MKQYGLCESHGERLRGGSLCTVCLPLNHFVTYCVCGVTLTNPSSLSPTHTPHTHLQLVGTVMSMFLLVPSLVFGMVVGVVVGHTRILSVLSDVWLKVYRRAESLWASLQQLWAHKQQIERIGSYFPGLGGLGGLGGLAGLDGSGGRGGGVNQL